MPSQIPKPAPKSNEPLQIAQNIWKYKNVLLQAELPHKEQMRFVNSLPDFLRCLVYIIAYVTDESGSHVGLYIWWRESIPSNDILECWVSPFKCWGIVHKATTSFRYDPR